jgi:hypothetical protein
VLAEAYARLQTITGAGSILRLAFRKTLETELPSIRLLDGAETRPTPGQDSGAQGGTPDYDMRFAVEIVVRSETDDLVGPALNGWRDEVIDALGRDRTTGLLEPSFGGLLQWATCTGCTSPEPPGQGEPTLPEAAFLVHFAAARPEAELNPFLQAGF